MKRFNSTLHEDENGIYMHVAYHLSALQQREQEHEAQIASLTEKLASALTNVHQLKDSRDSFQRVGMETLSTLIRVEKERDDAREDVRRVIDERNNYAVELVAARESISRLKKDNLTLDSAVSQVVSMNDNVIGMDQGFDHVADICRKALEDTK